MGRYPYGFWGSTDWEPWGGAPWWSPRGRFFNAGEVRLAILSLLAEGPRHGYDLMKELAKRSGGTYKISAGTIYPTLQQLEDEGLIVSEQQNGKKVYRLTEAGEQELDRESAGVDEIWRRAERWNDWGKWMRPEAMVIAGPLGGLVKTAMKVVAHKQDSQKIERVREILERAREEMEQL